MREFENQREQLVHHHGLEKEEMLARFAIERDELNEEVATVQRDRDDQLILAENEKQQVSFKRIYIYVN